MELQVSAISGSRILCVDDSPDSLEILRIILIRKGALVTSCASAENALGILANENFDAIVTDLSMPPGLDGYDLAHALRKMEDKDSTRQATPTIAVSSNALRPSRKRRYADFQVYLPKPVDKARLIYIIERLLEADSEVVKLGSLDRWEAEQAIQAAAISTKVAATATAAAAEAVIAAADATDAARDATTSAEAAKVTASKAETEASAASKYAPGQL
jgi:CheY-like chemotaxis protein